MPAAMFWTGRWWHRHVLRHRVTPMETSGRVYFDGLFDAECSCGTWFFAKGA